MFPEKETDKRKGCLIKIHTLQCQYIYLYDVTNCLILFLFILYKDWIKNNWIELNTEHNCFYHIYIIICHSLYVCMYVRFFDPLPVVRFHIWAHIWTPWGTAELIKVFWWWSEHKQKSFYNRLIWLYSHMNVCLSVRIPLPNVCLSVRMSLPNVCLSVRMIPYLPLPKGEKKAAVGSFLRV